MNTNDHSLVGSQTITITVYLFNGSAISITFNVVVTLLHPCKVTSLTSSQTISTIIYPFGDPTVNTPFTAFDDSVATQYSDPTLCGLVYSITDPTSATNFGVALSGMQITVVTTDSSLIGQSVNLNLLANANP